MSNLYGRPRSISCFVYRNGKPQAPQLLASYGCGGSNPRPTRISRPSVITGKEQVTRIQYGPRPIMSWRWSSLCGCGSPSASTRKGVSPRSPAPSGATDCYRYAARGVVAEVATVLHDEPLRAVVYQRDAVGNVVEVIEQAGAKATPRLRQAFDTAGRLLWQASGGIAQASRLRSRRPVLPMAEGTLWHRRGVLGRLAAVAMWPVACLEACASGPFALALVFESRSSKVYLDKFEWPGMLNKRGMFGGGGMYINVNSAAEMSFMAEEIHGVPEWIDLSWQSPLVRAKSPNDFESQFVKARRYDLRVYPRALVPQSVVDDVRNSRGKVLKLHFVFDDAKAWVEYEVQKWR